jgi:hypothetical protein
MLCSLLLVAGVAATVYFRIQTGVLQQKLDAQNTETRELQKSIDEIEAEPGYNKIALVRDLIE